MKVAVIFMKVAAVYESSGRLWKKQLLKFTMFSISLEIEMRQIETPKTMRILKNKQKYK